MRYRALSASGDYTFGRGSANFYVDSPDTVRQSVQTRLALLQGEWYLDNTSGTPWFQEVLDKGHSQTYDLVIQTRILQTKGVVSIVEYQSQYGSEDRSLSIVALLDTIYGQTTVEVTF